MGSSPGAKRGDVELFNNFVQDPMPKKSGSGSTYEIENGLILVQDTSVTPSVLKISGVGSSGPHYMSRGARVKITDDYILSDNGTVQAALDTDKVVSAVKSGRVLLEFTNECTPTDRVMTDNGKVKKYDGSGQDKIVGTYRHKPGEGDGKSLPSVITAGQLGWVDLGEGR